MKRGAAAVGVVALAFLCSQSAAAQVFDESDADRVISVAQQKLAQTAAVLPVTSSPTSTQPDGTWNTIPNTDVFGWTQGFFPGAMWLLYQGGNDPVWRTRADAWTRPLEIQKTNTATHDLGFRFMPSYGRAFELTDDPYYRDVALTAAASLASRYDPTAQIIVCCDWNPDWQKPLVVDTMMNLELLLWAADHGGSASLRTIAINHAVTTMNEIVRANGSTFHVVDYYAGTNVVRWRGTFQGYSDSSTWARGQAWAIYGFTMMYRYTGDARFLATAQKTADFYLSRVSGDMVPNWDLDAPSLHKDSSAAAIVASALLELSQYAPNAADQLRYRTAALQTLESLASPAYLNAGNASLSILAHGVGNLPDNKAIDAGLIYGDYYLLEAVNRFRGIASAAPIHFGATWRYDDRGVDPGPQWAAPSFNDSAWPSGPAQLGYGEGDEATVLNAPYPRQPSLYFRTQVTISGVPTQAALRVLHDDGVAVFVNGTQVFSRFMGNGTAFGAWASGSGENTISEATLPLTPFVQGVNTIAVIIKQVSPDSSDASFDLALVVSTRAGTAPPPSSLTVISPNGGEVFTAGETRTLQWSTSGTIPSVKLELSTNGGSSWSTIAASVANTGSYPWTVPATATTAARIRISDASNPAVSDASDASFTISVSQPPPTSFELPFGSVWKYDARNVDPGPQWVTLSFNDSGWSSGPGQLGYGDGDEATVIPKTSPSQSSVYFRRKISLSGPVTAAQLRTIQDDGIAVWVNGTLVFSKYVGNGLSHGAYASAVSAENELTTTMISPSAFVQGDNIIAVMVKQHSGTSSDLSFDLALSLTLGGGGGGGTEETSTPIPLNATWRYDDSGVDRGTAWLALGYDDSAWRSGPAQLGYGDGDEATVIRHLYPAPPSFYFRKKITLSGTVTRAELTAIYDDAVAVWINGHLVLSRNMGNGTSFGAWASASGENTTVSAPIDLSGGSPFVSGENIVTVMVKQVSPDSSDVSFALKLDVTTRSP